jgi:ABC-type phosphate transport system substrate-binding protein
MKSPLFMMILALLLFSEGVSAQSFKTIVNSGNSTVSLTKKEASDLFLKKKTKWADGTEVKPVDLITASKTREDFSQEVHGKNIQAIKRYWQQMAFLGTTSAPPEKSSETDVVDYVKKNIGAIGYVSLGANIEGVKTINVN